MSDLDALIKRALQTEIDRLVDTEVSKVVNEQISQLESTIRRRVKEEIGKAVVHIVSEFSSERVGNNLRISVDLEKLEKPTFVPRRGPGDFRG